MKAKKKISHSEISTAMRKFLDKGGIIHRLPAQNYHAAQTIGEDKYQIYESLTHLDSLTQTGEIAN